MSTTEDQSQVGFKHREALLSCLTEELSRRVRDHDFGEVRVESITAHFIDDEDCTLTTTGFVTALDYVVNNVYWGDDGDWSEAVKIEFQTS